MGKKKAAAAKPITIKRNNCDRPVFDTDYSSLPNALTNLLHMNITIKSMIREKAVALDVAKKLNPRR